MDSKPPLSDLQTQFVAAVRAAADVPSALRERAADVAGLEISRFDDTYLAFLEEQIGLGARGPEWTARLERRRAGLAAFCDQPLLSGRVLIEQTNTEYSVKVDPATNAVVYWEEYSDARTLRRQDEADSVQIPSVRRPS